LGSPYFIRDVEGDRLEVLGTPELTYALRARHYFGYLSDLETILYLSDELNEREQALMPAEAVKVGYEARFALYDGPAAFPVLPMLSASVVQVPSNEETATFGPVHFERLD
jgi:hypothetical protein